MMKSFAVLAVGIALSITGCAKQLAEAPAVDPIHVCQAYVSALNTVTTLMQVGVVDPQGDVADRVADVVTVVAPICESPTEPASNSAALQLLLNGVANLIVIQTEIIQTSTGAQ